MKIALFLFLSLAQAAPSKPTLSLEDFLSKVETDSPGLKSAKVGGEGSALVASGAKVIYFPYAFGTYTQFDDRTEQSLPTFEGDRNFGNETEFGIESKTPIGLTAKYSYNINHTEIKNAPSLTVKNYYTVFNKIELKQSILRNGFGSEVRAQKNSVESANLANAYAQKFGLLEFRYRAESAYWRLAFARRSVEVQKEVLSRAAKVLHWAKKRVEMQLGDRADLLQSQSTHDLRRLDLMQAEEEEKNAALAFNNFLGRDGSEVVEELKIPNTDQILASTKEAFKTEGVRFDVKAAEQRQIAAISSAQLDRERFKPTIDLFADLSWNGKDAKENEAKQEAKGSRHTNKAIGVTVSFPLAVPPAWNGMKGNAMTQEAAAYNWEQKKLEAASEWNQVTHQLSQAKERLELVRSIERVQKEKAENENQRLLKGRTTTYQALTFEQDYAATQLNRLRTQSEVLQLMARLKTYQGKE